MLRGLAERQGKRIWTSRIRAGMSYLLVTSSALKEAIASLSAESIPPSPYRSFIARSGYPRSGSMAFYLGGKQRTIRQPIPARC